MRLFSLLYEKVLAMASHQHAARYLAGLSFAESSFFPMPPDILMIPMALAKPHRAWHYAFITTFFSVLGGILGYFIGALFHSVMMPFITYMGYESVYLQVQAWFLFWGFWAVVLAGFSPIPYKVFTMGAGAMGMPLLGFFIASIIGRGGRFFLVAGLLYFGGDHVRRVLDKYINRIALVFLLLLTIGVAYWKLLYRPA